MASPMRSPKHAAQGRLPSHAFSATPTPPSHGGAGSPGVLSGTGAALVQHKRVHASNMETIGPKRLFTLPPSLRLEWGSPPFRALLLFLVLIPVGTGYLAFDVPAITAETLKARMGLTNGQLGALFSVYALPNAILPLASGILMSSLGVWPSVLLLSAVIALGATLGAVGVAVKSFPLLLAGRAVYGLGGESIFVGIDILATGWYRGAELGLAYGLLQAAGQAGSLAAFLGIPALVARAAAASGSSGGGGGASGSKGEEIVPAFILASVACSAAFLCLMLARVLEGCAVQPGVPGEQGEPGEPGVPGEPGEQGEEEDEADEEEEGKVEVRTADVEGAPVHSSHQRRKKAPVPLQRKSRRRGSMVSPPGQGTGEAGEKEEEEEKEEEGEKAADEGLLNELEIDEGIAEYVTEAGDTASQTATGIVDVEEEGDGEDEEVDLEEEEEDEGEEMDPLMPRRRRLFPSFTRLIHNCGRTFRRMAHSKAGRALGMPQLAALPSDFWLVFAGIVAYSAVFYSFLAFGPDYLQATRGMSDVQAGRTMALVAVSSCILSPASGLVLDAVGYRPVAALGAMLLACASFAVMGFAPVHALPAWAPVLTAGLSYSLLPSALYPMIAECVPPDAFTPVYATVSAAVNALLSAAYYAVGRMSESELGGVAGAGAGAGLAHGQDAGAYSIVGDLWEGVVPPPALGWVNVPGGVGEEGLASVGAGTPATAHPYRPVFGLFIAGTALGAVALGQLVVLRAKAGSLQWAAEEGDVEVLDVEGEEEVGEEGEEGDEREAEGEEARGEALEVEGVAEGQRDTALERPSPAWHIAATEPMHAPPAAMLPPPVTALPAPSPLVPGAVPVSAQPAMPLLRAVGAQPAVRSRTQQRQQVSPVQQQLQQQPGVPVESRGSALPHPHPHPHPHPRRRSPAPLAGRSVLSQPPTLYIQKRPLPVPLPVRAHGQSQGQGQGQIVQQQQAARGRPGRLSHSLVGHGASLTAPTTATAGYPPPSAADVPVVGGSGAARPHRALSADSIIQSDMVQPPMYWEQGAGTLGAIRGRTGSLEEPLLSVGQGRERVHVDSGLLQADGTAGHGVSIGGLSTSFPVHAHAHASASVFGPATAAPAMRLHLYSEAGRTDRTRHTVPLQYCDARQRTGFRRPPLGHHYTLRLPFPLPVPLPAGGPAVPLPSSLPMHEYGGPAVHSGTGPAAHTSASEEHSGHTPGAPGMGAGVAASTLPISSTGTAAAADKGSTILDLAPLRPPPPGTAAGPFGRGMGSLPDRLPVWSFVQQTGAGTGTGVGAPSLPPPIHVPRQPPSPSHRPAPRASGSGPGPGPASLLLRAREVPGPQAGAGWRGPATPLALNVSLRSSASARGVGGASACVGTRATGPSGSGSGSAGRGASGSILRPTLAGEGAGAGAGAVGTTDDSVAGRGTEMSRGPGGNRGTASGATVVEGSGAGLGVAAGTRASGDGIQAAESGATHRTWPTFPLPPPLRPRPGASLPPTVPSELTRQLAALRITRVLQGKVDRDKAKDKAKARASVSSSKR